MTETETVSDERTIPDAEEKDVEREEAKTPTPVVKSGEEEEPEAEETPIARAPVKKSDIIKILEAGDYRCAEQPHGMVTGVRLDGVKGSRGVHLNIVHVVDWRGSLFTSSQISMKAAIMEVVNRDTMDILNDVGLSDMAFTRSKRTAKGKVHLKMMQASDGHSGSMVHETRLVYVVTKDTRPTVDLAWLTDSTHIIGIDQFPLARQSDRRAILSEVCRRVNKEKWERLERSIFLGWVSILLLAFGALGLVTSLMVTLSGTGNMLWPLIAMLAGCPTGLGVLFKSRQEMGTYQELVEEECTGLRRVGETGRIIECAEENADAFKRLSDLSFVISPLMAKIARAIGIGDIKSVSSFANRILDEIVGRSYEGEMTSSPEKGLAIFLGVLAGLDPEYEEEEISLCYIALSNVDGTPQVESEIINHCGVLLNTLARCGIILPDMRDKLDNKINGRGMKLENVKLEAEDARLAKEQKEALAEADKKRKDAEDRSEERKETSEERKEEVFEEADEKDEENDLMADMAKEEAIDEDEAESEPEPDPVIPDESEPVEIGHEPETTSEPEPEPEPTPEISVDAEPESVPEPETIPSDEPIGDLEELGKDVVSGILEDATKVGVMSTRLPKKKVKRRRKSAA